MGFNDKVEHPGALGYWDVCTDAGFAAIAATLGPGEYRSMPGMNDAISSVRESGRGDATIRDSRTRSGPGPWGAMAVAAPWKCIRARARMAARRAEPRHGRFVSIGSTTAPAASSSITATGSVQRFELQRRVPHLRPWPPRRPGTRLDGRVSSARMVDEREARRSSSTITSTSGAYDQPQYRNTAAAVPQRGAVLLFPKRACAANAGAGPQCGRPGALQFNDRAVIVVNEGQWEVCSDSNFHGRCEVIGPGEYGRLNAMENQISSLRRVR